MSLKKVVNFSFQADSDDETENDVETGIDVETGNDDLLNTNEVSFAL